MIAIPMGLAQNIQRKMSELKPQAGCLFSVVCVSGRAELPLRPNSSFPHQRISCTLPQKGQSSASETRPFLTGFSRAYCHFWA